MVYLKNARIPQLLQVVDELHYWAYYLFLINFIAFIFYFVFFGGYFASWIFVQYTFLL